MRGEERSPRLANESIPAKVRAANEYFQVFPLRLARGFSVRGPIGADAACFTGRALQIQRAETNFLPRRTKPTLRPVNDCAGRMGNRLAGKRVALSG